MRCALPKKRNWIWSKWPRTPTRPCAGCSISASSPTNRPRKSARPVRHQKKIEIKTIRLTPRTGDYHKDIGVRNARKWLEEGKKVKFMVRFKSREISYPEIGQRALQEIAEDLSDIAVVEQQPTLEGWRMTLTLAPESAVPQKSQPVRLRPRSRKQPKDKRSPAGLFFRQWPLRTSSRRLTSNKECRKGCNHAKGNEEIQTEDVQGGRQALPRDRLRQDRPHQGRQEPLPPAQVEAHQAACSPR
jgi:hypothetical protein